MESFQTTNSFVRSKYSLYDADVETWKSILNLANKLEFKEVKELAIRELHMKKELPLVEKMALYQQHKVDSRHLVPLFAELCSRDTPPTLEESKILGPESTFVVYSARESLRAKASDGGRSPLPPGLEEEQVFHSIEKLLGMENGSTLAFHRLGGNSDGKPGDFNVSDIPRLMTFIIKDRANGHHRSGPHRSGSHRSGSHHGRGGTVQLGSPRTPKRS